MLNASSHIAMNVADLRSSLQFINDTASHAFRDVIEPGQLQPSKLHPDQAWISIVGRHAIGDVHRMGRTVADHVQGLKRCNGANGPRGEDDLAQDLRLRRLCRVP